MTKEVAVDGAGRLVLPKEVRERFRLSAGDILTLEVQPDAIRLKPAKTSAVLKKVNGVLVLTGTARSFTSVDVMSISRDERLDQIARD